MPTAAFAADPLALDLDAFQAMIGLLAGDGFTVLGPTVREGAIVPGPVATVDDLPRGYGDVQGPGTYRLRRRDDDAWFGYAADAVSWKSVLFPARELMWRGTATAEGFEIGRARADGELGEPPYAILGIRACDLAAVAIHDRILRERSYPDPRYDHRRRDTFLVTVTCSDPSGTCFCVSMGTGPRASAGYDLALTELVHPEHRFVAVAGTPRGSEVLARLATGTPSSEDLAGADELAAGAAARMGRAMETDGIKDLLYANAEHPRWDDVASRCLACGNCTLVCPTCFCTSVEEHTSLSGLDVEHWRVWDSCFTSDFSYLHGGSVRGSVRSRYRQWMTHKLASWHDQFGTSGCVGCGRCIAWCPVGIDITEEAAAIRSTSSPTSGEPSGEA
jgi:ferredoxin